MPNYDLICDDCGHKFSVLCSVNDRDKQKCPQCDSKKILRRFTSVHIGRGKGNYDSTPSIPSGFG